MKLSSGEAELVPTIRETAGRNSAPNPEMLIKEGNLFRMVEVRTQNFVNNLDSPLKHKAVLASSKPSKCTNGATLWISQFMSQVHLCRLKRNSKSKMTHLLFAAINSATAQIINFEPPMLKSGKTIHNVFSGWER